MPSLRQIVSVLVLKTRFQSIVEEASMAKGKFNEDTVYYITKAISETGRDIDGFNAGGISKQTFYRWLDSKPEFVEKVNSAKELFRKRFWLENPELIMDALKGLKTHLSDHEEIWKKRKTIVDASGNILREEHSTSSILKPPSPWALKAMLGIGENNRTNNDGRSDQIEVVDFEFVNIEPEDN